MITITLNGENTSIETGITLSKLLEARGLNREGIAVAVNHRVIPRSEHQNFVIPEGAAVEVIRAVGGG